MYKETLNLIEAHYKNQQDTIITPLMQQQAQTLVDDKVVHHLEGQQADVYQLKRKIGQGGMSTVYLGERNDGEIEQTVAIKFIFPSVIQAVGDDFLNKEAQHLANLNHPNIAKIHTVGRTEEGLPYLVMEYIQGLPIDEYCKQKQLDLNARLSLFQKVCDAVHFAHQNMIIHADIKPSNILVDELGEPKLMDFGIARVINDDGNVIGVQAASLEYASPEQMKGTGVTASSDVYSLGKVLEKLCEHYNIELDSIVNKAIRILAKQRFSSVDDLVDTVNRFINCQPIACYSNSNVYKFKKFLRKNFVATLSFALIILTISAAGSFIVYQKLEADFSLRESNGIGDVLISIFSSADPEESGATSLKSVLEQAANLLASNQNISFARKNELVYQLLKSLKGNQNFELSLALFDKIEENHHTNNVEYDKNYYIMLNSKAIVMKRLGRINEALGVYKIIEAKGSEIYGSDIQEWSSFLSNIGVIYDRLAQYKTSIEYTQKALAIDRVVFGNNHKKIGVRYNDLASSYLGLGDFKEAQNYAERALKIRKTIYGIQHPKVALIYRTLGSIHLAQNKYTLASANFAKALEIDREVFLPGNIKLLFSIGSLSSSLISEGKLIEAEKLLDELELNITEHEVKHYKLNSVLAYNRLVIALISAESINAHEQLEMLVNDYKEKTGGKDVMFKRMESKLRYYQNNIN